MTPVEKSERERVLRELARKAGEAGYCNIPALMEYLGAAFEAGRSAGDEGLKDLLWESVGNIERLQLNLQQMDGGFVSVAKIKQDIQIAGRFVERVGMALKTGAGPIADKGDGNG